MSEAIERTAIEPAAIEPAAIEPAAVEPAAIEPAAVEQVRRFNRATTQRAGALNDAFLGRGRPLGQARLLWEIGSGGGDLRELRARLDLDSGYLTRLLAALQADGLVRVEAGEGDRRLRVARLTEAGQVEWAVLERLSDEAAAGLLARVNAGQRERLLAAMAEVERLLTASLVTVSRCDPDEPDAVHCLRTYYSELAERFAGGFDVTRTGVDAPAMRPPAGLLLVARLPGAPVGCGALLLKPELAKIKRMWVAPSVRGLGLGRRLLAALEAEARAAGHDRVGLETNSALAEAIAMYRRCGYTEVEPFDDEPYAEHWFMKAIT